MGVIYTIITPKTVFMSKIKPLQEIILANGTGFANRNYSEKKNSIPLNRLLDPDSRFKEDCTCSQIKEVLPELFRTIDLETKLFLWQIREYSNTFTLELSEEPMALNTYKSIDPYVFMETINFN